MVFCDAIAGEFFHCAVDLNLPVKNSIRLNKSATNEAHVEILVPRTERPKPRFELVVFCRDAPNRFFSRFDVVKMRADHGMRFAVEPICVLDSLVKFVDKIHSQ